MFTGVIESQSHEGGFLVSFTGSSPALESIIINADTGTYIGKVDGVLGNTNAPLAHVAHIDRKLDLEALVGIEVSIRPKKQREERRDFDRGSRDSNRGRTDNRRGNDRGHSDNRRNDRGGRFQRDDRGNDNRNGGDWECPKCRNSNFAFRQECNRCGEPRGNSNRRGNDRGHSDNRRNDRGGRFQRDDRGRGEIFNDNDWECPQCKNSNFAFRTECNRCGAPRSGGNSRGQRRDSNRGQSQRNSTDRPPRRDTERPPRREGERPPRRDGRDRRDERGYGNQNNNYRARNDEQPPSRKPREPRTFRKSRGNGPGHAHNRPPKPLIDPDRDD